MGEGEATRLADAGASAASPPSTKDGCLIDYSPPEGRPAGAQHHEDYPDGYPPLVDAPAGALPAGFFGPPHL